MYDGPNALAWFAGLGALGMILLGKRPATAVDYGPTTVPILAGESYLWIVRLSPLTHEDAARAIVESKGATMVEFASASVPPFWATSEDPGSERIISFKATPQGNSTVTLGQDFYGIGRLERVIRL